jgi:glycosyltransferase involved in cell wall biosynthesis
MRVAHLLRKYDPAEWGGTETVIHQLFDGLRGQGVESVVYCPRLAKLPAGDPLAEAGCRVERFHACVPVWGLTTEERKQMIAVGGNLMSFDLLRALWLAPDLSLIHSHALGRVGGIGLTIARKRKVPFVVTVHGGVYDLPASVKETLSAPKRRGIEWGKPFGLLLGARKVLEEADAILTCNRREAVLIRERHPDRRVVVQPHGVPAHVYRPNRREEARVAFPRIVGRDVLLSVGRIDPVKNQGWLVEEMPALIQRHPNALLVLAGACTDEAYGAALERRIEHLGLGHHVYLAGRLPPADPRLIGLMQEARVMLLQSISETFGLVILEGWAAGTPVVSSRTSGASALIEHGRNGWLFDLNRPESFHVAIDTVFTNPAAAQLAAGAGRERVESDYDTRVLAARLHELYGHLQEERHALCHSA